MLIQDQPLFKSITVDVELCIYISITLTEGDLLIFFQSKVEKMQAYPRIEHVTFDLSSRSGAFDLLASTTMASIFSLVAIWDKP